MCKIGILIRRQSKRGESLGMHKESNKGITCKNFKIATVVNKVTKGKLCNASSLF